MRKYFVYLQEGRISVSSLCHPDGPTFVYLIYCSLHLYVSILQPIVTCEVACEVPSTHRRETEISAEERQGQPLYGRNTEAEEQTEVRGTESAGFPESIQLNWKAEPTQE